MIDFSDKLAVITGGSSGIGLALAKKLSSLGANVLIIGRRPEQLQQARNLIEQYRKNEHQAIRAIAADVSDREQIRGVLEEFLSAFGAPDILINSAGVTHPGIFVELPLEVFDQMININYLGTVNVTQIIAKSMIPKGSGHIVNISSVAGFLGVYGYSAYGPSKYAVRGFSDVIRAELKPRGIRVSVVFPPDTQTPQLDYEAKLKPEVTKYLAGTAGVLSAERVADDILRGVARGKYIITPGFETTTIYYLNNLLGNLVYSLMDWMIRQALKQKNTREAELTARPNQSKLNQQ